MELLKRLPPRLLAAAGAAVILGYLVFIVAVLADGYQSARRGGAPVFTDFTPKYAASLLVQHEPAANLYIPARMMAAGMAAAQAAYGGRLDERQARGAGFSAWMYPPFFILLIYPLALLPYLVALVAWLAVTAVPYLLAMRAALRSRAAWLLAFASPAAFYNLMFGQTGFLTGGLIGLGLSQLHVRPALAGVCLGLASVKPHFGVLVPLALVAGDHWKSFGVAVITVLALTVASVLAFGMDPWYGMIGTLEFYGQGFGAGAYNYVDLVTVQGMFELAGAGPDTAWKAQALAAAVAVAAVIWAWRQRLAQPGDLGLQAAILCAATLLAVPLAYSYDMVLLMPAVAWILADMKARGGSTAEVVTLVLAVAALLPLKAVAGASHFQYGPLVSLTVLALAAARLRQRRRQAVVGAPQDASLADSGAA